MQTMDCAKILVAKTSVDGVRDIVLYDNNSEVNRSADIHNNHLVEGTLQIDNAGVLTIVGDEYQCYSAKSKVPIYMVADDSAKYVDLCSSQFYIDRVNTSEIFIFDQDMRTETTKQSMVEKIRGQEPTVVTYLMPKVYMRKQTKPFNMVISNFVIKNNMSRDLIGNVSYAE